MLSGSGAVATARAWPMLISPRSSIARTPREDRAISTGWRHGCATCGPAGRALPGCGRSVDQLLIALGLLDRVEVLALDILDQRDLGGRGVVEIADDRRDSVQLRPLRRAPAPLAGDDLDSRRRAGGAGSAGARPARRSNAASSASASSSKCWRGWSGLGADPRQIDLADAAALDVAGSLARGARTASPSRAEGRGRGPGAFFMPPPPPLRQARRSARAPAGYRLRSPGTEVVDQRR